MFKSRIEPILTYTGEVININTLKEWSKYMQQGCELSLHWQLLKDVSGVFQLIVNNKPLYTGYTSDLQTAIRREYFRRCALAPDTFMRFKIYCSASEARAATKTGVNYGPLLPILFKDYWEAKR